MLSPPSRGVPRTESPTAVGWEQVRAFRLERHGLAERVPRRSLLSLVGRMGGAQAQLLSAAELSLAARVCDLEAGEVATELWTRRRLAKAWCMRRTLHLLPSRRLAEFVRGSASRAEKEIRWTVRHWIPAATLDRILRASLEALAEPRTRQELTEDVARRLGTGTAHKPAGGWGSSRKVPCLKIGRRYLPAVYLLHLLGAGSVLCSGPPRKNEPTFVRADAWVPEWTDVPRPAAEESLLRTYLGSHGPANVGDYALWMGGRVADAADIWARLGSEIAPVSIEGWDASVLRRDLSELTRASIPHGSVRLLPHFDSYLLAHRERGHLVDADRHRSVYREQGWVAPVVLRDGVVIGTWQAHRNRSELRVDFTPFVPVNAPLTRSVRAEAELLAGFLGSARSSVTVRGEG